MSYVRKIWLAFAASSLAVGHIAQAQSPQTGASPVSPAPAVASDLKTLTGQVYKNARVFRIEPDGINYMFSGGMVKIPFPELPEAIRKQYGYDAKAATAFALADDEAQQQAFQASQAQLAADARLKQATYEQAARHATDDTYLSRNDAPLKGEPKAVVDPGWQGGLKTLAKLSVKQLDASPFTLKNALVQLTGIARIDIKEVSEGVYRLTIWSEDYNFISATLPAEQAQRAKGSDTLFVAVADPASNPVEVRVFGNACIYKGLSTMPTVVWH